MPKLNHDKTRDWIQLMKYVG